ncbi:MAG: hypothetical protein ACXVMS_07730 [Flavisolibacter sp.]
MKHGFLLFLFIGGLAACKSGTQKESASQPRVQAAATAEPPLEYAYKIDHPDNWVPGPRENTQMVLQSLKSFENGDIDASLTAFADSVELRFDGMEGKFSRDSVRALFSKDRKAAKQMKIDMEDFESVRSKDGRDQWVSLWYKQKWQDQKGVWDSLAIMDDLKIVKGKVALLDEKSRHYPRKKS